MKRFQIREKFHINLLFLYFCFFGSISFAQWTTDTKSELPESKSDIKNAIQMPVTIGPALKGPVDPEKYFVGPSDVLSVNIWISPPLNFSLTVTPEGTLSGKLLVRWSSRLRG